MESGIQTVRNLSGKVTGYMERKKGGADIFAKPVSTKVSTKITRVMDMGRKSKKMEMNTEGSAKMEMRME